VEVQPRTPVIGRSTLDVHVLRSVPDFQLSRLNPLSVFPLGSSVSDARHWKLSARCSRSWTFTEPHPSEPITRTGVLTRSRGGRGETENSIHSVIARIPNLRVLRASA